MYFCLQLQTLIWLLFMAIFISAYKTNHRRPTSPPLKTKSVPTKKKTENIKQKFRTYSTPLVPRKLPITDKRRIPLDQLKVNQTLTGRIISIVEHGMFVDVNTIKDGLLHIKDICKQYYIHDLESKYEPGQDIEVYVKFVDLDRLKLGLQMFPIESIKEPKLLWEDMHIGQEVKGRVERYSDDGVLIDIDAEVSAFLHRKKIKTTMRQRRLKPWELISTGHNENVTYYIYNFDEELRRIALTTFPPEEWDLAFGKESVRSTGIMWRKDDDQVERELLEFEEEEDDDDDDSDDVTSVTEEILSAEEIERLTGKKLLLDDLDAGSDESDSAKEAEERGDVADEDIDEDFEEEEIELDELFDLIAYNKNYVSFTDLRMWDPVRLLFESGALTDESLMELFVEAGGVRGKLSRERFPDFIDVFFSSFRKQREKEDSDDEEEEEEEIDLLPQSVDVAEQDFDSKNTLSPDELNELEFSIAQDEKKKKEEEDRSPYRRRIFFKRK